MNNIVYTLAAEVAATAAAPAPEASAAVSATNAVAGPTTAASCLSQSWYIWVVYGVVIVLFYFALIRPQKKQRQQEEQMRNNIEIGDEIITIGGICGRVVSIKEDETLVIETGAERTKMKIKNWAISSRVNVRDDEAKAKEEAEAKEKKGLFGFLKK